jgi:hypothetical protein
MFDCSLRSRGSRLEAAAFLSPSQTKSVSARSFVQDSGAPAWLRAAARDSRRSQLGARALPGEASRLLCGGDEPVPHVANGAND